MLSRRLLRIKAVQVTYAALERGDVNGKAIPAVKEFTESANHCYKLYIVFLELFLKLREYAKERIEISKSKFHPTEADLNPNMRFVENPVITEIEEALESCSETLLIDWEQQPEIVAELYRQMTGSDYYKFYMGLEECTLAQHKRVLMEFILKTLVENENIENLVEEKSIYWIDDIEYAASFAYQSIDKIRSNHPFTILDKYDDDDVEDFGRDLVRNTILECKENIQLVIDNSKNWDADRISIMDKVILATAIAEIKNFPSIPVKVSIDEYLEISKFYSNPDSPTFINGILDKITRDLDEQGLIVKSGRGLLQ